MLILTRKLGESICIGKDAQITVKVLRICHDHVKLGIEAPTNVAVNRKEVLKKMHVPITPLTDELYET